MRQLFFIMLSFFVSANRLISQDFITRGRIEYEVKVSERLQLKHAENGGISPDDLRKISEFDISKRELLFAGNQWTYKRINNADAKSAYNSALSVYVSRNTGIAEVRAEYVSGQSYIMRDSLPMVRWKIENETRQIAGWQCRKAVTRIQDSVYVIAFYCPEIVTQGGPELFSGLPGMILGLAIPRYYTTWFATKIELADIDESKISSQESKKDKAYGKKELAEILVKKYKEAGWEEASIDKVFEMLNRYTF